MKYAILMVAYCDVVVEADTEEEALDLAMSEVSKYDFEIDSAEVDSVLDTKEKELQALRHCNAVI